MKTTRAMLVIGVLMLVLAVIVAQGLRPEETATVSVPAPVVSGAVSRTPEYSVPEVPVSSNPSAPSGGVAAPRDAEASGMGSTTPASPPQQARQTDPAEPADLADSAVRPSGNGESAAPVPPPSAATPAATPAGARQKPAANQEERPRNPEKLVVTTSAPKTLAAGQKAISRTRLEIGPRAATFRLTGVSALQGRAFALKEPDRVVVDLNGAWGVKLGRTPANALVKSVRAGSQEANTRLVFDLHKAPKSFKLVQVGPKTLELQLR